MKPMLTPVALVLILSCFSGQGSAQTKKPDTYSGVNVEASDPLTRVQDDLYRAVNGRWLSSTKIPADKAEVYAVETPQIVKKNVLTIIEELARKKNRTGSIEQKIGDYYRSYIDLKSIDEKGSRALMLMLNEIDELASVEALAAWQGKIHGILKTPIWLWGGFADFQNPNLNRTIGMQGGLGLPDRAYYVQLNEPRYQVARDAYVQYLRRLAELVKLPQTAQLAHAVMNLETLIAEAEVASEEAMNPAALKTWSVDDLEKNAPGFAWRNFLLQAKIKESDKVNFMQPQAVVAIAKLYESVPLQVWKTYFKLRLINESATVLPEAFREAHSNFHDKAMRGAQQAESRQQQAVSQVSEALSEALSRSYVERYFAASSKTKVQNMFDNLIVAAQDSVAKIDWMSATTKSEALAKIGQYKAKIAYPKQWRDYSGLSVLAGDALGNQHRAKRFEWERQAAMSGTPVDRSLWMMSPLEVNAYYDPSLNEINLPAAFLQKPLFDPNADDASNYGRLGAFIAHEISHGFDSNGAMFDSRGMLRNWWTDEDQVQFKQRQSTLVSFYEQFEVLPEKHVNGKLTLPENMADILGLQLAFQAYQSSQNVKAKLSGQQKFQMNRLGSDGLTDEQRFFVAYAQSWAVLRRDERTLALLASDPHSPNSVRSNATVMHVDAFHRAFNTKPGDKMYLAPEQRFRLW